jgi:hypothetical protein
MRDAFVDLKPLSVGYFRMACHANDLVFEQWAPVSGMARAEFDASIAIRERGLSIPGDVSISGFGNIDSAVMARIAADQGGQGLPLLSAAIDNHSARVALV